MMTRALRRAGLALALRKVDRANVPVPGNSTPAREALLAMHMRWLEIVGREAAISGPKPPRMGLIPAPVGAQVGGTRAW